MNKKPSTVLILGSHVWSKSYFARINIGFSACSKAALIGSLLAVSVPGISVAQEENSEQEIEEVRVTGSRIRRQDFEANSPIATVDRATFEETGTVGVETILNQLPQFVPAVTQFDTTSVQNTATATVGASTIDLRGLGSNRSLTLINGRRGQPVNASLSVDTNSIPSSMIERVEVISGGASAVYGADAIGGVVNFIMKDNFEGATINTRYGISEDGLGEEYQLSGLFGASMADGRGNVMFGMEYSSREEIESTDVDWRVDDLNNPNIAATDFFLNETYLTSRSRGNLPSQAATDAVFSDLAPGTIAPLMTRGSTLWINPSPDGTGAVFTGGGGFLDSGTAPQGNYKYTGPLERPEYPGVAYRKRLGNGLLAENALDQWSQIPLERFSFSGVGTFDFTEKISGHIEARFSKNRNKTILGYSPSAIFGNAAIIPYGDDDIWLDSLSTTTGVVTGYDADQNPIFDAVELAATPTNAAYLPGGIYGLNCPTVGGCSESDVFPMPQEVRDLLNSRVATASHRGPNEDINLNRPMDYIGGRATQTDTTTFQMVAGVDGEFGNGFVWDVYLSHGQTETLVNFNGFASLDRWRAVAQSPNFGVNFRGQNNEEFGGQYSGVATCATGLPLIREFEVSADCIKAVESNLQNSTKLEQNTLEFNLAGDIAELPAGALQFSVGAGYRSEDYEFNTDNLTTSESFVETALGLYPTSNTVGDFDVKEIFGELLVPVVSDVPGIQMLNLELGARTSDYSTVGDVSTYKALLDWSIVDWARVRGGYQKANRAPNIGELFLAPTYLRSLAGASFGDQCSMDSDGPFSTNPTANPSGNVTSLALCQAMMGGAAADYYSVPAASQPTGTGLARTVGNPDLTSEEAETWTMGVVLESPSEDEFWGGFKGSIDWYEIEITDMIAVEGGNAVFENCLNPSINVDLNPNAAACQNVGRDPLTGNVTYTSVSYTNQGRTLTSGIDLQLDWSGEFDFGGIGVNILANKNLKNITQEADNLDEVDWAGTRGCALGMRCMGYDYKIFTTLTWFDGPWNTALRWRFYPEIDATQAAEDPGTRNVGVHSSYSNFSLSGGYQVSDSLSINAGIENLFDKLPPKNGGEPWREEESATDYNRAASRLGGDVYDPIGRRFYISASLNF